jgi:hypothetical protein
MSKKTESFLEGVKRLANIHRERCKTDPVLRASWERSKRRTKCNASHKKWDQDWDVHGALDSYCSRCGVCDVCYYPDGNHKESYMTCDEILAAKKK